MAGCGGDLDAQSLRGEDDLVLDRSPPGRRLLQLVAVEACLNLQVPAQGIVRPIAPDASEVCLQVDFEARTDWRDARFSDAREVLAEEARDVRVGDTVFGVQHEQESVHARRPVDVVGVRSVRAGLHGARHPGQKRRCCLGGLEARRKLDSAVAGER